MRRAGPALGLALALTACAVARTDARIRPGWGVAVTTAFARTPDATTTNNLGLGRDVPPRNDASNLRGNVDLAVVHGGRWVELRWHLPALQWSARRDFPDSGRVSGPHQYDALGWLELYLRLTDGTGPWHAGIGIDEGLGGQLAVTYAPSPRHAVTVAVRGYLQRVGNAQLSYALGLGRWRLAAFVGVVVTGKDGVLIRANEQWALFDEEYRSEVIAHDVTLVGLQASWR